MTCEHCGGVSLNAIPYHKHGCATALGGWSDAQRKGIDTIVARAVQEALAQPTEWGPWEYEYEEVNANQAT